MKRIYKKENVRSLQKATDQLTATQRTDKKRVITLDPIMVKKGSKMDLSKIKTAYNFFESFSLKFFVLIDHLFELSINMLLTVLEQFNLNRTTQIHPYCKDGDKGNHGELIIECSHQLMICRECKI